MSKYGMVHPDDLIHDCCEIKKRLEEQIEACDKNIETLSKPENHNYTKTKYAEEFLRLAFQKILEGEK